MRKLPYFDPEWSMAEDTGTLESRLSVIADRYGGRIRLQPSGCVRSVRNSLNKHLMEAGRLIWLLHQEPARTDIP